MQRDVVFAGFGKCLPKRVVLSEELDQKLNLPVGTLAEKTGVYSRHFVSQGENAHENENAITMGANAVKQAVHNAGMALEDIDLIVSASGCAHQPIPCNAALIHRELGLDQTHVPAFDINSTCLSFLTAVDTLSDAIHLGRYKNVVIVSSEVASKGLDWSHLESAGLFGDGAAAAVLRKSTPADGGSRILGSLMRTFSAAGDCCVVEGGGTGLPAHQYKEEEAKRYLFRMDGRAVFAHVSKNLLSFTDELFTPLGLRMEDMNLVVPHQASLSALRLVRKKLGVAEDRYAVIVGDHGNNIAASLPMAIHESIVNHKLKRGDLVFLLGTSAGLSIGGMIFQY